MAKRALSNIIVPRDSVIAQECEKRFPIAREPLVVCCCDFALRRGPVDGSFVESFNGLFVLPEMPCFQPESVHVFKYWYYQVPDRDQEAFIFDVEWILPEVVVQVPDEMDKTFLLAARHRVVAAIEVGNQRPL